MKIVSRPNSPYRSMTELVSVALENQLGLEETPGEGTVGSRQPANAAAAPASPRSSGPSEARLAMRPPTLSTDGLLGRQASAVSTRQTDPPSSEPLSSFTNRLTPMLVGPRVLWAFAAGGHAPEVDALADAAAAAARALGLMLREEDERAGKRGRARRSTGWPVGQDEVKSLARFRNSFLLRQDHGKACGPLVDLGLLTVHQGKVYLTDPGQEFAAEPISAIDDSDGVDLFTDGHRRILLDALVAMPGERREIDAFMKAVRRTGGDQDRVDGELASDHPGWSEAQVVSHRAAMLGRLRDLSTIDVEPLPAGKARIVAGPNMERLLELLEEPAVAAASTRGGDK